MEDNSYCKASGKTCYATKQKAYKMAEKLRGPNGRALMDIYKCPSCKMYHLTHKHRTKKVCYNKSNGDVLVTRK